MVDLKEPDLVNCSVKIGVLAFIPQLWANCTQLHVYE